MLQSVKKPVVYYSTKREMFSDKYIFWTAEQKDLKQEKR